ncbi:hypothetical protein BS47DRAFT_1370176, partial [Hydnum rufescens UP504]
QHIPPQRAKSHSHKPNPRARQDPTKRRTPLCTNAPMNEGQRTPEATGNEGATHLLRRLQTHKKSSSQDAPPQRAKSRSHKPNLRARQDPTKRRTPLRTNAPTNEGQRMPEATGNEGATHPLWQVCGEIKPRRPTPTREVTQPQAQPTGLPRPHEMPHPIMHERANERRATHA